MGDNARVLAHALASGASKEEVRAAAPLLKDDEPDGLVAHALVWLALTFLALLARHSRSEMQQGRRSR
jgi:hypothetical protein